MDYDLEQLVCPTCGIRYAAPKRFLDARREAPSNSKERNWYCPNGHSLVFTDSEADQQRRRANLLKQENARLHDRILEEERRTAAFKGQITKLKKRASAGVCPCCNRTFQNLARHMHSQHPEFGHEELRVVHGGKP